MKRRAEHNGKTKELSGRPLMMYLLPGLLVAMVTVLLLAVLAHQVLSRGADDEARKTMQRAASLLSAGLGAEIQNRIDRLRFLASEPGLADWVQRGMSAEDHQAEAARIATWLPGVLDVRLLPAGWQKTDPVDQGLPAPLGYAGIDMLRRVVSSGKPAQAEIHQADIGKPYLALAVPLWRDKRTVGALLAAYPADALNQLVQGFQPLPGVLRLEQVVDKRQHVISELGAGLRVAGDNLEATPVAGTIWQIRFGAAPQLAFGLDLVPFLGFVLLGLLPLALIFWLQLRLLARALRHDLDGVVEQTDAFVRAQPASPMRPRLALTSDLLRRIGKVLRDGRQQLAVAQHAQAAPAADVAPEPAAAAPVAPVDIPAEVFRAYDIRGKIDQQLTPAFALRLGMAVAAQARAAGGDKVVVGRDARQSSATLQQALMEGLMRAGCDVVDVGMAPTPLVYFEQASVNAAAAVVVTGSHNPVDENGFKIVVGEEVLAGRDLAALRSTMQQEQLPAARQGDRIRRDADSDYLAKVAADVVLAQPMKVVVDAGNGAAGPLAVDVLKAIGCEVTELFCEPDGSFPNHHPDPSRPENLTALSREVLAQGADIGLAFDGDGDRLGVVDSAGNHIWPDRVLMLLAQDLLIRQPGTDIVYDVKSSRHLGRFVLSHGGRPIMGPSGHSRMRKRMNETGAQLGGEFSGHFFVRERWYPFDDALYAAARVLEIIAAEPRSSAEQFADLPSSPSTPEFYLPLQEGQSEPLMDRLLGEAVFPDAELVTTDGLRIEFADAWGLVRASNTSPSLVFRFEADDEAALTRVQGLVRDWLGRVAPELPAPF
jgi:phosphomannomutase/phosphoglucomutase